MRLKAIESERFQDFKLPSMFIATCFCDFKCCKELGLSTEVCQNEPLAQASIKEIPDSVIYTHFASNPISKAVVFGGMEPFLQFEEILSLLSVFRNNKCDAPFVIYTGYYPEEIVSRLEQLASYQNVIVKFGRFVPGDKPHFDPVLGVELASNNQYAKQIS